MNNNLKVNLTAEQVNVLLELLANLTYSFAHIIIHNITTQCNSCIEPNVEVQPTHLFTIEIDMDTAQELTNQLANFQYKVVYKIIAAFIQALKKSS